MKIVYGTNKNILAIGVAMVGNEPMPFFGFVDKDKMQGSEFLTTGPDTAAVIDKIEELGGIVVFVENHDAAGRLIETMSTLFNAAADNGWGEENQPEGTMQ